MKAWQVSKDYARSREIPNESYTSLNYESTDKKLQTLHEISQRKTLLKNLTGELNATYFYNIKWLTFEKNLFFNNLSLSSNRVTRSLEFFKYE